MRLSLLKGLNDRGLLCKILINFFIKKKKGEQVSYMQLAIMDDDD